MGPSTREPISARRDSRLDLVLRVLRVAAGIGVLSAAPSWFLPEPERTLGLASMVGVACLFVAYTLSARFAARGERVAARRLLFSSWVAYLFCHVATYRPDLLEDQLEVLDVGLANVFAALAIVGCVVLAEWRDAVRWIAALIAAYVVAALGVAWAWFDDPAELRLWLTTVGVSTTMLMALAVCVHAFASDLEAALAESERLRAAMEEALLDANIANTAKNRFLANMSHELRTPLTGIVGYTELLQELLAEETTRGGSPAPRPDAREILSDLDHVRSAAVHLRGLIDDVLDLAKIEAGMMHLDPRPTALARLAEEAVATVRPLADQRRNELSLDLVGVPPEVVLDADRFRQVLLNLLSNAVKFTEGGRVAVLVEGTPDGLRVVVSDTGIGIPDSKLSLIFQPFEQADKSTTRRFGGTGLGLAIARHLVEVMGGEITVASRPGIGSTFTFTVPWLSQHTPSTTG